LGMGTKLTGMDGDEDKYPSPCSSLLQGRRADLSGAAWWHAPQYLQQFTRTADIPSRHRLRSSVTDSLFVPAVRLSTVDRRDFPV